jgi:hypothetical protein
MRVHQLEVWVHNILDRVTSNKPVEDDRVELKSSWIPEPNAARRLAAHANGAHGEPILWIVGIDEKAASVTGAEDKELSEWWQRVQRQFDLVWPELLHHLVVPIEAGSAVVALLFDTRQGPYLVKNQTYGRSPDSVEWEVPWRDGTRTRTARRSELLRILSPRQLLPDVENRYALLTVEPGAVTDENRERRQVLTWNLYATAYFAPRDERAVVFPFHRTRLTVHLDGVRVTYYDVRIGVEMEEPETFGNASTRPESHTPVVPKPIASEWVLRSPYLLTISERTSTYVEATGDVASYDAAAITAQLGVVGSDQDVALTWQLLRTPTLNPSYIAAWSWDPDG